MKSSRYETIVDLKNLQSYFCTDNCPLWCQLTVHLSYYYSIKALETDFKSTEAVMKRL